MRFLLLCVLAGVLSACATTSTKQGNLVGRWRSDTAPTGYWIVDRYSDGRFAEKQFLSYDYKRPTEILLAWGQWRQTGKTYKQTIEGSTSPFVSNFIGKTSAFRVASISEDQFSWENNEGDIRTEERIEVNGPLTTLCMEPTERNPANPNYIVTTTSIASAPAWVNDSPH
jgi:hypothetical protein